MTAPDLATLRRDIQHGYVPEPDEFLDLLDRIEALEAALVQVYWEMRSIESDAAERADMIREHLDVGEPAASEGEQP